MSSRLATVEQFRAARLDSIAEVIDLITIQTRDRRFHPNFVPNYDVDNISIKVVWIIQSVDVKYVVSLNR
jgi:hypothetical protein